MEESYQQGIGKNTIPKPAKYVRGYRNES